MDAINRANEEAARAAEAAAAEMEALAEAEKQARLALQGEIQTRLDLLSRLTGENVPVGVFRNTLIALGCRGERSIYPDTRPARQHEPGRPGYPGGG